MCSFISKQGSLLELNRQTDEQNMQHSEVGVGGDQTLPAYVPLCFFLSLFFGLSFFGLSKSLSKKRERERERERKERKIWLVRTLGMKSSCIDIAAFPKLRVTAVDRLACGTKKIGPVQYDASSTGCLWFNAQACRKNGFVTRSLLNWCL